MSGAVGADLSSLGAPLKFPIVRTPIVVTVEIRSADYVWQSFRIASPGLGWQLQYGPASVAQRDEAELHYENNKGLTFPWTNPEDSVTRQVRYEPEETPDMERWFARNSWSVRLVPANT